MNIHRYIGYIIFFLFLQIGISASAEAENVVTPYTIQTPSKLITASSDCNYVSHAKHITPSTGLSSVTPSQAIISTTFYDGFGRKQQSVIRNYSQGKDLANYYEYDSRGRIIKQWLQGTGSGGGNYTQLSELKASYSSLYPAEESASFNSFEYEPTISTRIKEERASGIVWQNTPGKRSSYHLNTSTGEYSAQWFTISSSGHLLKKGTSPASSLRIIETLDEDNRRAMQMFNFNDSIVLSRRFINNDCVDTYYVYDNMGNLRYILPPLASEILQNESIGEITDSHQAIVKYGYIYKYDHRNRLIEEKSPGMEPVYYVYDACDLLRFSQDGNQRNSGEWTAFVYDSLFRLAFTATMHRNVTASTLRAETTSDNTKAEFSTTGNFYGYSYENNYISIDDILSINYYDNYEFLDIYPELKSQLTYGTMTGYGEKYTYSSAIDKSALGQLTGCATQVLGDSLMLVQSMYYDMRGNIIQEIGNNHLGGYDIKHYARSFIGDVTQMRHSHTTTDTTLTDIYKYYYDNQRRITMAMVAHNGSEYRTIYENFYDDLGRLTTQITGSNITENIYAYNIHGQPTLIENHLYKQQLYYETDANGDDGYLSGNIKSMSFNYSDSPLIYWSKYGGEYNYSYDDLNRLTKADYTPNVPSNVNIGSLPSGNSVTEPGGNFSTQYQYDLHGNITCLKRKGLVKNGFIMGESNLTITAYGIVDKLTMGYNGNQLITVSDSIPESTNRGVDSFFIDNVNDSEEYTYDANGNTTSDKNKGISEIVYNELNLPQSIYFNDGHITEYLYDADGNKLRVVYKIDNRTLYAPEEIGDLPDDESAIETIMTRDYIGNHVYEDGTLERTIIDNGYITETDTYNFYIKDYQGNNVLTVEETAAGVEGNHWDYNLYYPYGCPTRSIYSDRYMYSGKELDNMNGLRLYDFQARPYDAITTRFLSPDPLRSKYPHISPYAYCANNPILYIDPTGCFIISKENAERYPKLNAYLYNRIKQITKNQHIMKHLIKYSEQSEDQIKRDFEYGKGPYINVFKFEDNAYGYFDASESKSTLNLDSDYVNMLETSSNLNSEIALFIIEVTILHEYVHYGDAQDGIDLTGEEGDQFEIATYGTIIDFNTATQLIIKYLENLHSNETQSQE